MIRMSAKQLRDFEDYILLAIGGKVQADTMPSMEDIRVWYAHLVFFVSGQNLRESAGVLGVNRSTIVKLLSKAVEIPPRVKELSSGAAIS